MPTYEYLCDECGHQEEIIQKISAEPLKECPDCASTTYHRLIGATGFILKGSGWYKTDYGSDRGSKKSEDSAGTTSEGSGSSESSSGETKVTTPATESST